MATAEERRKIRESWAGTVAVLRWVLPFSGGMAWAILMYNELGSMLELTGWGGGALTLQSLFFHPVLLFLDNLPATSILRSWGAHLIAGYYAALTAILWNAPRGRRRFWSAAVLYGLHAGLNFIGCLLYTRFVPGTPGAYFLWGDLRKMLELGHQDPITLFTFGALLLAWHTFAWWRLWLGMRHFQKSRKSESF